MRREKNIEINDRGNMRKFRIVEMSAIQQQDWIMRALLLLTSTDAAKMEFGGSEQGKLMDNFVRSIVKKGFSMFAGLDYEKVKPLRNELLSCCYRTDGGIEQRCTPENIEGFIDDMKTLFLLEKEALAHNFSFFMDVMAKADDKNQTSQTATVTIPARPSVSNIKMSAASSEPSYPNGLPHSVS